MEYVRKYRWASYSSPKCREYLRNDFSHECAYCKLHEREVGVVGVDFFEIDHFKPQSLNLPDMHHYKNLYYSCAKCNHEKSNIWDIKLLDPCDDDIFSGSDPAIVGGSKEDQYKYIARNERGTFYIDTFKLNSRVQIHFRRSREEHENNLHMINTLIDEIQLKIRKIPELHDLAYLFSLLDIVKNQNQQELHKNEMFEKAEKYLNDRGIENSLVFKEYNMDVKIKIHDSTYYCELIVDNSEDEKTVYRKDIDGEKLRIWFERLRPNFGILFYYPQINRMYFYPVSDHMTLSDTQNINKFKQIKIDSDHLIV